ncbi:MAG: D-alanyl-D-alanine carboxypeptidase family protein, partial [Pseudomonadota bacterium]
GKINLSDKVQVSDTAWKKWYRSGGSLMYLQPKDIVTVEQLIKGVIVSSGNDACTVLAETLAGTEAGFADWMNEMAEQIGMDNSHFTNASGWPDPDQFVTARDLGILVRRTVEDFPQLYRYYADRRFTYGKSPNGTDISQPNRNRLLGRVDGADGLKTGHTESAGFGLASSAARDGRRLVLVVNGLKSDSGRIEESARLLEYGFRNFDTYKLFDAGEIVETVPIWLGQKGKVPMVVSDPVILTLSRQERRGLEVKVKYTTPVAAPIKAGDTVGVVSIDVGREEPIVHDLIAGQSVEKLTGTGRIKAAFDYFIWGSSASTPTSE